MSTKYYNTYEFKQAHNLSEIDPVTSKILFAQYLEKYPRDYSTYPYYCTLLMVLGEFDEAEKILKFAKEKVKQDKRFDNPYKIKIFEKKMFYCELKLMCYQKRFKELYNIYKNKSIELMNREFNSIWFYVKKQLGFLSEDKRNINTYLFRQITKYDEEDFYDHIKRHLSGTEDSINNSCVFETEFPIKSIVEEMKKHMPSDKRLFWGFYDNIYFFKYDSCGKVDNKTVNYIKVICLDDTNNIITLCPVVGNDNLPHIDLNYMKEEEFAKVKRISQIDKFNQRYSRK